MIDTTLTNKIREGEIDINNQSLFFSVVIKGLLNKLYKDLKIRSVSIPHFILNTGDDTMYLQVKGQNQAIEPLEISNEEYVYNQIPRCIVNPKGINLIPDQLTSPYSNGVFQYEGDNEVTTFNAEFRRMPFTMAFELKYILDSFNDVLDLTQQIISKLAFIQTYNITYMGQTIVCSYKIQEDIESEYDINIDGNYNEDKHRKINMSITVESNFPIFNNRSVIQSDHFIKQNDFTIAKDKDILKERDYEIK